jgi:hypothetical protein
MTNKAEWRDFNPSDPDTWICGYTLLKLKFDDGKEAGVRVGVYHGANSLRDAFRLRTGTEEIVEIKFAHITGFDVIGIPQLLDDLKKLHSRDESES